MKLPNYRIDRVNIRTEKISCGLTHGKRIILPLEFSNAVLGHPEIRRIYALRDPDTADKLMDLHGNPPFLEIRNHRLNLANSTAVEKNNEGVYFDAESGFGLKSKRTQTQVFHWDYEPIGFVHLATDSFYLDGINTAIVDLDLIRKAYKITLNKKSDAEIYNLIYRETDFFNRHIIKTLASFVGEDNVYEVIWQPNTSLLLNQSKVGHGAKRPTDRKLFHFNSLWVNGSRFLQSEKIKFAVKELVSG